jgi:hypothetical protein
MQKIVKNYFNQIEDCSIIQKLITDVYCRRTRRYFKTLLIIYIFGFVIPFMLQIVSASRPLLEVNLLGSFEKYELPLCFVTQGFFFYIELIQLYNLRMKYLRSVWNLIDVSNFAMFVTFYAFREKSMSMLDFFDSGHPRFLPISYMADLKDLDADVLNADEFFEILTPEKLETVAMM